MRKIVVANQKGGSGKTTTAVNLAAALVEKGRRVLLFDLDPQRSASRWMGFEDKNGGAPNVLDALHDRAKLVDTVRSTNIDGVDLIPCARKLVHLDSELASFPMPAAVLRERMRELPEDRWDYLIVDTPPDLRLITMSALIACDEILISVQLSNQDIEGMSDLMETVAMVVQMGNPNLRPIAIVPCRVNMRTRDANEVHQLLVKHFNGLVSDVRIRDTVKLRECQAFRKPITQYDPGSAGAQDYRELAARVEGMVK